MLRFGVAEQPPNSSNPSKPAYSENSAKPREPAKPTMMISLPAPEQSGDRIGRYKLLQEIGDGGMGVVWMAEQMEPVHRRVALKVIKLGMDTKQVIGRFEAERQALALMDHPNIAKVLDAGATDTGRPYFVMELVKGIPMARYCDENKFSTRQRLDLFIQVCYAIQHAHQKGVIHRDIKPSNILIADHDGVPVPKVIDFGIAKATTGQPLTDKTVFTGFEQFIGTPAYMSPEQAKLSGLDLDTRSDIYSLGVLLYELLTGKTPFDSKRLLKVGLDEIRRIIREEDPPFPSNKLSTLEAEERTTLAKRRQSEAPKLVRIIRGDLDWIVMKALEKDRNRRYATANDLAMDVQRHLHNEPVTAVAPSPFYKFRKFARRNKGSLAAASTIVMLLVTASIVSSLLAVSARRAKVKASAEAEKAKVALNHIEVQTANAFLARNPPSDPSKGLALLARVLHADPSNRIAAESILNAFAHRIFLIPDTPRFPDGSFLVRWSKNSPHILVGLTNAQGSFARLYDRMGNPLGDVPRDTTPIVAIDISADARVVVTATENRVRAWSAPEMLPLFDSMITNGVPLEIKIVNGKQLLVAAGNNVALWLLSDGSILQEQKIPDSRVRLVTVNEPADLIAVAGVVPSLQIYRLSSLKLLHTISNAHESVIRDLQFNSDGSRLISAGSDSIACIWDSKTGERIGKLSHGDTVYSAAISPNNSNIVTACSDGTVYLWDLNTLNRIHSPLRHEGVASARFSPNGQYVLTVSDDSTAREWDISNPRGPLEAASFSEPILQAQFMHDGRILTVVEGEGVQILSHTLTLKPVPALNTNPIPSPQKLTLQESNFFSSMHLGEIMDTSIDGRLVVTSFKKTSRVLDRISRRMIGEALTHESPVNCARFSPDGQRVVTSTAGMPTFRVWDVYTGSALTDTFELSDPIASVFFSADGSSVIIDTGSNKWSYPVRTVKGAAPKWLPELAEAVAGLRYNEERIEEHVTPKTFLELKANLLSSPDVDPITTCAKQFLASVPLQQQAAKSPSVNGR